MEFDYVLIISCMARYYKYGARFLLFGRIYVKNENYQEIYWHDLGLIHNGIIVS